MMVESLDIAASNYKPPQNPLLKYKVEVRHRSSIPYNVKYYQVFEDEQQIKCFMEVIGESLNLMSDQENKEMTCEQQTSW